MKRIPRKKIVNYFKVGWSIHGLGWEFRKAFPGLTWADREIAILNIIREHIRKQDRR